MSKKIKPKEKKFNINFEYNEEVTASCACGTTFKTGSTNKNIRVDICATCHPFFTGEKRFVDSEGRVEKFKKKYEKFNK